MKTFSVLHYKRTVPKFRKKNWLFSRFCGIISQFMCCVYYVTRTWFSTHKVHFSEFNTMRTKMMISWSEHWFLIDSTGFCPVQTSEANFQTLRLKNVHRNWMRQLYRRLRNNQVKKLTKSLLIFSLCKRSYAVWATRNVFIAINKSIWLSEDLCLEFALSASNN